MESETKNQDIFTFGENMDIENIENIENYIGNVKNIKYKKKVICFGDNCCNSIQQKCIKFSNKIIIPEEILTELLLEKREMPYFFKVINEEINFGVYCGIHEASAPPGVCYLPNHVMDYLNLSDGNNVILELVKPENGTYIKLQPHSMDFVTLKNVDPKKILEKTMSKNYPILTKGNTLPIYCEINKRTFYIDIVDTKPCDVIKIIDVNLNVDFAEPKDYLRNKAKEEEETRKREEERNREENKYDENKFPGVGFRLGSS